MKEERVHLVLSMAARGTGKTTGGKEKRKQAWLNRLWLSLHEHRVRHTKTQTSLGRRGFYRRLRDGNRAGHRSVF